MYIMSDIGRSRTSLAVDLLPMHPRCQRGEGRPAGRPSPHASCSLPAVACLNGSCALYVSAVDIGWRGDQPIELLGNPQGRHASC